MFASFYRLMISLFAFTLSCRLLCWVALAGLLVAFIATNGHTHFPSDPWPWD
ncbi:MAG TPA: hypothetical protein VKR06_01030 [Ktedonosporobacter sp.]|nr:hypothetical protein [Ktedonosporobacter sp.]